MKEMGAYITSSHIKQLKFTILHCWLQVYSCLFWMASTLFIHDWKMKERQLEMMMMKEKNYHSLFTSTKTALDEQDDPYYFSYDPQDNESEYDSEEEEEEECEEDEEDILAVPWTKEATETLHSFDTSKSECKSITKKKIAFHHIKSQVTAWKQKHFHNREKSLKLFNRSRILPATFRRKTSPDITLY